MSTSALPLGNHSDPFGEGYCCGFFNYHVGSGTTAVSLAGVASSAVLCISLSTTVILLQRAYTRSYTRDRLPLDALLRRSGSGVDGSGHARASDRDRSSGGVLPAYHGFALGVCLLFFLQAAAWLLPQQAPYDKLSTTVFALCTFVDLVPVIHMTRGPRARFWTSMAAGAVLAVLLLVFVMLLRTTIDCEWCSLHFPRPGVQYADAAFGLYFLVVGILSRKRLKIWPMRRPPRPALAPWAFTLAFTYLLSAIAIWLLTSKVSSDLQEAAFCMLDIVLIQYALMYAPMFYRAIVADSEFMRRRDMKAALQGSAFAPLLSSGHGDVDHGTFYNNLDSDSDRDATGTSGSVGLQAVGAVGAGGVGAAGGGGGSKQQRKRNTSSSKSAAKARNRHEDDDDHDDENDDIDEGLQAMVNDPNLHMIGVNDVVLHRRVGSGGYGNVWFAEWRGCACAVKELFALAPHQQGLPVAQAREAARALLHEVAVLARLRHPHCVLFYGLIISQRLHGIVTEYMDGGSVHDLMHVRRRKFSLEDKKRVLRHCASGMHYLHTLDTPLLHRDLKTKNLLVDEHCTVIKVCCVREWWRRWCDDATTGYCEDFLDCGC